MYKEHQQGTPVSEAEIAWLAGIIEGEGSISLAIHRRNEAAHPKVSFEVKVYNTDAAIIAKVVDILDRCGFKFYMNERANRPSIKAGGKEYSATASMLSVIVKRMQVVHDLLTLIRPWLVGDKSHRADLVLRFIERRFEKQEAAGGYKRIPYDKGDIEIVAAFYRQSPRPMHPATEGLLNEYEQSAA